MGFLDVSSFLIFPGACLGAGRSASQTLISPASPCFCPPLSAFPSARLACTCESGPFGLFLPLDDTSRTPVSRASDRSSACQDQVPSGRFQTRPVLPTLQLAVVTAATTTRLASRRLACLLQTSICLGLGLDLCLPESSYSTLHPLRNVWYVPATAQPSCACTATAALNCDCTCALSHHHLIDSTRSVLVPSPPPVPSWPGPILFFGTAELRLMTHSSCLRRPACRCKFVSSAS